MSSTTSKSPVCMGTAGVYYVRVRVGLVGSLRKRRIDSAAVLCTRTTFKLVTNTSVGQLVG